MDTTQQHEVILGDTLRIELQLSLDMVPITGATVEFLMKRDIDSLYYNGSTWQVAPVLVTLPEYDATNFPGYYKYSFIPSMKEVLFVTIKYVYNGNALYESHTYTIKTDELGSIADTLESVETHTENVKNLKVITGILKKAKIPSIS